ncbi:MAG: hypothetical protein K6E86_07370 [Bacteroidales bacterium]|nr:hypothetical protein [Bacteroidales bacterium]
MKKFFSLVAASLVATAAMADDLAEGVYYIKSASSDLYLTRGQNWGTRAVVEPYGHPWKVTLSEGKYSLYMYDLYTRGVTTKYLGSDAYVDSGTPLAFTVASGTADGSFTVANGDTYVSPNSSNAIEFASSAYDWKFLTVSEYAAAQQAATTAQETAVATAAGIELDGATLTTYLANNYVSKAITTGFATVPVNGGTDWTFTAGRSKSGLNYGDYGCECFAGSGNVTQTVSGLAAGIYKVGIKAMQRSTSNAVCYALGQEGYTNVGSYLSANGYTVCTKDWYSGATASDVPNTTTAELEIANNGGYYSEVYTYVGNDGELNLTVNFPSYWSDSWFIFNGIDIVYYLDASSGTATLVAEFSDLVATADSLLALPMDDAVALALTTAKADPSEDTVEAYNNAITALKQAINAALVSTKKYDNTVGSDVTSLGSENWDGATGTYSGRKERYNDYTYVGDVMTQTISGLIPGAVYEVVIEAAVSTTVSRDTKITDSATGENLTMAFANEGMVTTNCVSQTGTTEFPAYTVTGTVGADSTLTFGLKNVSLGANWFVIKLVSITTKGNPTVDAYNAAKTSTAAVASAIDAATEALSDVSYADLASVYQDTLQGYADTLQLVENALDSLYAQVALLSSVDSLVNALPEVAAIERLATEFQADIVANQHLALKKATLVHTASVCWGSNKTGYNNVDGATAHYNNNTASGWAGTAFAEFSFDGVNAKSITKATLTWTTATGGSANKTRDNYIYYLNPGTALGYDTIATATPASEYLFSDARTLVSNYKGANTFTASLDVAAAINAMLAAGQTSVIFQWTGNAAGADLSGSASDNAPTLEIEYDMAPSLKTTVIEDFEALELAEYSADWKIGNADRFTTAFATRELSDGTTSRYFTVTAAGTNGTTHAYNKIANTTAYKEAENICLDFDFAMSAIANGSAQNQVFTINDTLGNAMMVFNNHTISNAQEIPSPIKNAAGDTIGYYQLSARTKTADYFYHVQVATSAAKTVITVTDVAKDTVAATLNLAGGLHVGTLTYATGKTYGMLALDNVTCAVETYAEIIEDPVFTVTGESYDTLTVALSTETDGAVIKYSVDAHDTLEYTAPFQIDSCCVVAAWAEKNGEVSNVISSKLEACVTPVPALTYSGSTYATDTITLATDVPGAAIYYYIKDAESTKNDTLLYTDKFVTLSTIDVVAWAEYESRESEDVTANIVAGEIAAPVVTMCGVDGASRYVAFNTTTTAASIVYTLNDGDEVVGKAGADTIVINADTKIKVLARFVERENTFESAAVDTTMAAGTELQLAGVDVSTDDYSAITQKANLKLSTSQLEVLLNPAVEIVWAYGDTTNVAANGDVITGVPVGATFTAYARAAGYVDSKVTSLEVVPSYASTIFYEDYEDGTLGSWTSQVAMTNYENAEGTHSLSYSQSGQGGDRWAKLSFPEYSSSAYTLSFKWAVAAGNGASNRFFVYTGVSDTLFYFETATDADKAAGERATIVYNRNQEQIGTFTTYLPTRFTLPDKFNNIEVTVSATGTVLTVVNNLGQTQIKTKISEEPVIITGLHEILGRAYGIWGVDDVKLAGRSGSIMAPEFTLDHYDVRRPAVAMTDATDKTEIYYRAASTTYSYDDKGNIVAGEYTFPENYTKYESPVVFENQATIIEAYAVFEGLVESAKALSTVYLRLDSIEAPTVAFASAPDSLIRNFTVTDNTSDLVTAALFYQAIGAEKADTLKTTEIATDSASYGWFSVYAQVGDLASPVVYRYVDSRASYTEPYFGLSGDGCTFPATVGDFEAAVGATIAGEYPTEFIKTTGTQFIHYAVNGEFAVFSMPFDVELGVNVFTNAKGDTLKLGEDYKVYTLHVRNAQNTLSNKNLDQLATNANLASAERAEGTSFSSGVPVIFQPLTEKVGSEIVLHSSAAATIEVTAAISTVPTNGGWRIFPNVLYQNVQLESDAYVLNEAGTKFVYTEKPVLPSLGVAILVDADAVKTLGSEIIISSDPSGISNIAVDGQSVDAIYDLQGRKVQNVRKGELYVIDGARIQVK